MALFVTRMAAKHKGPQAVLNTGAGDGDLRPEPVPGVHLLN